MASVGFFVDLKCLPAVRANLVMDEGGGLYATSGGYGMYGKGSGFQADTYERWLDVHFPARFHWRQRWGISGSSLVFDSNGNLYGTTSSGVPYGYDSVVSEITL